MKEIDLDLLNMTLNILHKINPDEYDNYDNSIDNSE